jgi:hypothetical protein
MSYRPIDFTPPEPGGKVNLFVYKVASLRYYGIVMKNGLVHQDNDVLCLMDDLAYSRCGTGVAWAISTITATNSYHTSNLA